MRKKKEPPCLNIITNGDLDMMGYCCGIGELGNFKSREYAMVKCGESYYDPTTSSYQRQPNTRAPLATINDARKHLQQLATKTILATTIPSQRDAVQALKAVGFKRVTTTPSKEDPRRTISLWMWQQKPIRRKRNG